MDMKRRHTKWIALFALFFLGGGGGVCFSADTNWTYTGGVGEWSNASNWDNGVPGSNDTAYLVTNTDHAQVTSAFDSGGNMTIVIRNNATLAIGADFRTAFVMNVGISGIQNTSVTQTAGTLIGRTLNLGNDAEADTFEAKYTLSGGISRFTTAVNIGKNGILDIQGDGATIQFNNAGANAVTIGQGALSYTLGATGVSAIDNLASGGTFTIGAGSGLLIDASAYTGGVGTIELVKRYTTIAGTFDASNISITGLAAGLSGEIIYDANSIALDIIPEPGTYALLGGLLALGYVMVRRRS